MLTPVSAIQPVSFIC